MGVKYDLIREGGPYIRAMSINGKTRATYGKCRRTSIRYSLFICLYSLLEIHFSLPLFLEIKANPIRINRFLQPVS